MGATRTVIVTGAKAVATGAQYAQNAVLWTDRKVGQLAESHLSQPYATIVQRAFECLPSALAYIFVPSPFYYAFWAGYVIIHMFHPKPLPNAAYQHFYTGVGVGAAYELVKHAIDFGKTGDARHVILGLVCMAVANFCLNYGGSFANRGNEDYLRPRPSGAVSGAAA